MITLGQLRGLIKRTVKITLADSGRKTVFFTGYANELPVKYNAWTVTNITEFSNFDCMIEISGE